VIDNDSYKASFDLYLHELPGDVWTVEMTDRDFREIELFGPMKGRLPKKIAVGVVSHRSLQVDTPQDVAARGRLALEHIDAEQLILSTDCGFGRQGCNRDIAFFKSAAIAQARDLLRAELGIDAGQCRAADPQLQTDIVPDIPDR
jgi:5-methyltetrahydropteroyltriglutamate--homocysteine methyltransferase